MKIYSMTATFGKLEHQTLTLEPGLNVISAPNEWGKSTWCAFLVAMLYGIDTRERSKQGALADKERYAPWSGSPMSGRMDLNWNGRNITIQRATRGRAVFGEFAAFETDTGLPVPELTAENCGQHLLGVEKSVFTRAGFIRLADLPVSEDDALRRRLNALVTTGDESGASDDLEQKLRDLKNRCRHNKTGRLPQLEAQRKELQDKLQQLEQLQQQSSRIAQRQEATDRQLRLLENHQAALAYEASREDARRVTAAKEACLQAQSRYENQKALCDTLPTREEAQENILQLEQLRMDQDALQAEALPQAPVKPETPKPFTGMTPGQALTQAAQDKAAYDKLAKPVFPVMPVMAALCIAAAVGLAFWDVKLALPFPILAAVCIVSFIRSSSRRKQEMEKITGRYGALPPQLWTILANDYSSDMDAYIRNEAAYNTSRDSLQARKDALEGNAEYFTGGASITECLEAWRQTLSKHEALETAYTAWMQAKSHADALAGMAKAAQSPAFDDSLTYDENTTRQLLADANAEHRQLQLQQGHVLGQMEALGQKSVLEQQLSAVQSKIRQLEDIYAATVLAMDTLTEASNSLQRKFAPRISRRAQTLFARLTQNRYDRLLLGTDLSVSAGAEGEDILRSGLWRSDGTADQQYLALRLAVAEELTPNAPLVLDDALVRFDDTRLSLAMAILKEEAKEKQVIVFTCQNREQAYL